MNTLPPEITWGAVKYTVCSHARLEECKNKGGLFEENGRKSGESQLQVQKFLLSKKE